jgi:hypothetical protein
MSLSKIMEGALAFFQKYEVLIYVILGLGALIYVRKFVLAWQELRGAAFGLERENAQSRLNHATSVLVLLLTMAIAEFMLASFVIPVVPDMLPSATTTLVDLSTPAVPAMVGTASGTLLAVTPSLAPTGVPQANGCVPGQVEISSPTQGEEVSGLVTVNGTVDIPKFAFYKLEIKRPDESQWTILLAGNQAVQNGALGVWDTRRLSPGEYIFSVVPVNSEAQSLPRCFIQVRVASPPAETQSP